MDKFIKEYRSSFLESDLTLYNYNPRTKFENYHDSVGYRFYSRPDNKLLISVWPGINYLDTSNRIQKLIYDYSKFISENETLIINSGFKEITWLGKDSLNNLVLLDDSNRCFLIPKDLLDFDPILYFADLEELINRFGILEIRNKSNYYHIVFDSENSLYYFQDSILKDTLNISMERIDDKWYISYGKINTDYN